MHCLNSIGCLISSIFLLTTHTPNAVWLPKSCSLINAFSPQDCWVPWFRRKEVENAAGVGLCCTHSASVRCLLGFLFRKVERWGGKTKHRLISYFGNECPPQVSYLLIYFTCNVNMMSLSRSWHWWAATSSAACVARLRVVIDWWRSWPMANTLACLCSCQWWTFWTYLVTVSLFSVLDERYVSHHA